MEALQDLEELAQKSASNAFIASSNFLAFLASQSCAFLFLRVPSSSSLGTAILPLGASILTLLMAPWGGH